MLFRVCWGLGLFLSIALAGCDPRAIPPVVAPADETPPAPGSASGAVENNDKPDDRAGTGLEQDVGLPEAALAVPQEAVLVAEDPEAQINMRADPDAEAAVIEAGFVGDKGVASHLFAAEDGYEWYYIRLSPEKRRGWVRADFVDIVTLPTAAAMVTDGEGIDVLSAALDDHCGGPKAIEAYYETDNFIMYVCRLRDRPLYISNEIGTPQVLITEAVERLDGATVEYIARQDNYEYHMSDVELVVYRIADQGALIQVLQERVTTARQY